MDDTILKTEGRISASGPASPQVRASRHAILVGAAVFFALAANDALSNSLKGKTKTEKEEDLPSSVFVVPANLKEGRNPFYPNSTIGMRMPSATPTRPSQPIVDVSELILNGITPSGVHPTAMINGRTFDVGETAEVHLPSGQKLPIKVEEIKEDSVVLTVRGQHKELHLRRGL